MSSLTETIEADLRAERFKHAIDVAKGVDLEQLSSEERDQVASLVLRCRAMAGEAADRLVLDGRALLAKTKQPRARAFLRAELAYALIRKRVPVLSRAEVDAVEQEWPQGSIGPAARAWWALSFDKRDEALEAYQLATTREEPHHGWFGLGRVHFIRGAFDASLDALSRCLPGHVGAMRYRSDIAVVRAQWTERLSFIEQVLALTPGGDRRRWDLLDRASALLAMDRRDEGLELYRALWREAETDGAGRFARDVLNHFEKHGASGKRVMLAQFPTVTQKRNYCGPATLELVLRSQGVEVAQDDIAPQVKKHESGSTVLAMTRYLESHGLATRRFEATPERLKACVEQGLPVIVEEEYSTTTHVAVVIGVDTTLGLVFVQDPMTHVTSERRLATQGELGELFRDAAIVAVRPTEATRLAALDAAGVKDAEHLRLLDGCSDEAVAKDPHEVIRRCDRALALVDDYPLAWYRRADQLLLLWERTRSQPNQRRFLAELRRARVRYARQEWPHLLHARWLVLTERWEEALIELEEALRIDPGDSFTAQRIAEAHQRLERNKDAVEAFWKTLTIDPAHVRANENFAMLALDTDQLELAQHLSQCAREASPKNPFNHLTAGRIAQRRGDLEGAIAHARRAVELEPEYTAGSLKLGEWLGETRDEAKGREATTIYLDLCKRYPRWFEPRVRVANRLHLEDRAEEAVTLLCAGIENAEDEPFDLMQALKNILLDVGQPDRAAELTGRYARARPTGGMLEVWWDALDAASREEDLLMATGEQLSKNPRDRWFAATHANRLAGRGSPHDEKAEELLRGVVKQAPDYGWARRVLAQLVGRDRPEEAAALLGEGPPDEWNLLFRARALNDAGKFDEAKQLLAPRDAPKAWFEQEQWNRALLGAREAGQVARALLSAPTVSLRDARAAVAFAIAAAQSDAVEAAFERIPATDEQGQFMAHAAAASDERFRGELARRLSARLADRPGRGTRRYLEAVAAGNDAARGELAAFEALLASEPNAGRLDAMAVSYGPLQRALTVRVVERRALLRGVPALFDQAKAAAYRGDGARCLALAREYLKLNPRDGNALALVLLQQLAAGELSAAQETDARLAKLLVPWVNVHAARGLYALRSGDAAAARRHAALGRNKATTSGYGRAVHPSLRALEGALEQRSDELRWVTQVEGAHLAGLWKQLLGS